MKFRIPFEPDWDKDFFVEAELGVPDSNTPRDENVGLVFALNNEKDSFYAMYISHGYKNQQKYQDFLNFRAENVFAVEDNNTWKETPLVNHQGYNRFQVYKIGNEVFLLLMIKSFNTFPTLNLKEVN